MKTRLFEILQPAQPGDRASRWFDRIMVFLILGSVALAILRTLEHLPPELIEWFQWLETAAIVIFTFEYLGRLWTATEHPRARYRSPVLGRIRFMASPYMVIDLLAILPFYVLLVVAVDQRYAFLFPMLRILRILKLVRYSSALETLGRVVYTERRILGAATVIMVVVMLFVSTLMYVIERDAQPEAFSSIPASMWWGIVTLTTVGYGDVSPITPMGKLVGALVTILGIGMFALPAGILANGFAQEIKQREFLVSWSLVAGVPLFSKLDAVQIAEITRVLEPVIAQADETIVREGEPADEMFFLVSGEVAVEVPEGPVHLTEGFFGEIALLKQTTRTATVRAVTKTRLLVLEIKDFHRLLEDHPEIAAAVEREADRRMHRSS